MSVMNLKLVSNAEMQIRSDRNANNKKQVRSVVEDATCILKNTETLMTQFRSAGSRTAGII